MSGCGRPSVGSSSLLIGSTEYRQATPRCYVPCAEPVTRQRGGHSEPPCQFEMGHSFSGRTRSSVSSSHPSAVAHHPARPRGLATGGAGRRPCIASPPAALTVGNHTRSHRRLHCLLDHQFRPVGPQPTAWHFWPCGTAGPCWGRKALCPLTFEEAHGPGSPRSAHCRSACVEPHPCHVVEQWSVLSRGASVTGQR